MDPEPLIALWPLRSEVRGLPSGMIDSGAAPGMPRGASPPSHRTLAKVSE
jgi:hypothetical protein